MAQKGTERRGEPDPRAGPLRGRGGGDGEDVDRIVV